MNNNKLVNHVLYINIYIYINLYINLSSLNNMIFAIKYDRKEKIIKRNNLLIIYILIKVE